MKFIALIVAILLPSTALADTLLICPSSYILGVNGKSIPQKSKLVVEYVAERIGTETEFKLKISDEECMDREQLVRAQTTQGTGAALLVQVVETSVHYDFTVHLTSVPEGLRGESDGTFGEALEAIAALVIANLPQPLEEASTPSQPEQTEVHAESATTKPPKAPMISWTPFWISLGVTGALGLTTGIIEIAGYKQLQDYEDMNPRPSEDENRLNSLQTAERVFLGLTVAGAITTTIVGIVISSKKRAEKKSLTLRGTTLCGEY